MIAMDSVYLVVKHVFNPAICFLFVPNQQVDEIKFLCFTD